MNGHTIAASVLTSTAPDRGGCVWPGTDPLYLAYHDTEWGVPERDSRALWEKLILDGFQAGLSWITILRRREQFRRAFEGFEPATIAAYTETDVVRLLADEGIIRHRGKIEATVRNARAYLELDASYPGGFSAYCWSFVGGQPVVNQFRSMREVPAATDTSTVLSRDLKKRGFGFCGPTIVYAWMQACGLVNDHIVDCFRHQELEHGGKRTATRDGGEPSSVSDRER